MSGDSAVCVRLELDELALALILDGERAATVLRTALRIADLEHFIQRDRGLRGRPELLYLVEDEVHIVITTRADTWAEGVEILAGLDYQQTDGDRPRCVWSVMATGCESIVRPTTPCDH
jgi:hypothetical protein